MHLSFDIDWIGLGIGVAIQTVFLTVALWIMLKLQHFDWNFFGLIGSAALACALDRIPYVGLEISAIVLLFCVMKLIHSRTFTDAIFSVGVAYAITFAFNMFVITALIGDLRHPSPVRARTANFTNAVATLEYQPAGQTNAPVSARPVPAPAPAAQPAAVATVVQPSPKTNASPITARAQAAAPEPVVDTNRLNDVRLAGDIMKHFFVKGVSQGATMSIAMISNGTKNYDVVTGDTVQLETSDGKFAAVKCESVADGQVVISVDGIKATLFRR